MRNLRLTIAYQGTRYAGWQVQPGKPTVQGAIEDAIQKLTGEELRVTAAGRTDAGVHALGQVANFFTDSKIPCDNFRKGLQSFLPFDIVVRNVEEVPEEFHSTYTAKKKRYRYLIHNSPIRQPFLNDLAWNLQHPVDDQAMHEAAQKLLGTHDFRSFESHFPNRATSVRTVMELSVGRCEGWNIWERPGQLHLPSENQGEFVWFDIVADGFLYNMVRSILGTLVKVGQGKWTAETVRNVLVSQDRTLAGPTAPAHGLYLVSVDY